MLTAILSALAAVGGAFKQFFNWLDAERLRTLGRTEQQLENTTKSLSDRQIADRIDADPDVTDHAAILERLRGPPRIQ